MPAEVGAVDPRAYLTGALTMSAAEATVTVKPAEALGGRLADTGEALAEGAICRERARTIVDVVTGLRPTASPEQQSEVEEILLESAEQLNARDLWRLRKVMEQYLDPDGAEPREEAAKRKRAAHLRPNGDGSTTLNWTDTDEQMALLQAALEPLSAHQPGADGEPDTRGPAVRRADALADLVSHVLRHGDLPSSRGARPHLIVTVTDQAFTNGRGLGITATGEHLSAAAVRRISCDADVTAIRLDTEGVPLSMGRTRRTVSPQQWLALVIRDSGCASEIDAGRTAIDRPLGRRHITSCTGAKAGQPTCRTCAWSATGTTTPYTTAVGTPKWPRADPNYDHRRGQTRIENHAATGTGKPRPNSICGKRLRSADL